MSSHRHRIFLFFSLSFLICVYGIIYTTKKLHELESTDLETNHRSIKAVTLENFQNSTFFHKTRVQLHSRNRLQSCNYQNETVKTPQFPTFVIVGAQKAGTSSLLNYFAQHPRILRSTLNETHFFDYRTPALLQKTTEFSGEDEQWCYIRDAYFKYWPHTELHNNTSIFSFEKTPSYLSEFDAPTHLRKTCPWIPKVIIVLRDPVERAYSAYKMFGSLVERFSFEEALRVEMQIMQGMNMTTAPILPHKGKPVSTPWDHPIDEQHWKPHAMTRERINGMTMERINGYKIIRKGMYAPQIRRWFQDYPRDSIIVVDYQDLQRNTSNVYYQILDFAGIPHDMPRDTFQKDRVASQRWWAMANSTRAYLEAFYAPYNAQLEDLLGEEWKGAWMSDW